MLLEKEGLHQATDILKKYGIDSETDLSELDQHDFSELKSVALSCKESEALVWSTALECATEMLHSSSTVPPPALTSSIDCKRVDNLMNRVSQSDSDDSGKWRAWVRTARLPFRVCRRRRSSIVMYNLGGGPSFAYVSASGRHQNNKLLGWPSKFAKT